MVSCINKFLIEKREDVKNIKDEDFETIKGAVNTIISEKDINLSYECTRFWNEIGKHKYNFKRQSKMVEDLNKVTKSEFIAHFEKVFFSDQTKRLDLQLTSEAHKEEQEKYRALNQESEIFKLLNRVKVQDSIMQFKK